jgi:hypothetical protein
MCPTVRPTVDRAHALRLREYVCSYDPSLVGTAYAAVLAAARRSARAAALRARVRSAQGVPFAFSLHK